MENECKCKFYSRIHSLAYQKVHYTYRGAHYIFVIVSEIIRYVSIKDSFELMNEQIFVLIVVFCFGIINI